MASARNRYVPSSILPFSVCALQRWALDLASSPVAPSHISRLAVVLLLCPWAGLLCVGFLRHRCSLHLRSLTRR